MRAITIKIEVYDNTTLEDIDQFIDDVLNDNEVDCTYTIEEKED